MTCKTGGFQETKLNYFNDLQKLRCQLIRLSIRAGTGIEPFKNKGLHGRSELAFLVGMLSVGRRFPRVTVAPSGVCRPAHCRTAGGGRGQSSGRGRASSTSDSPKFLGKRDRIGTRPPKPISLPPV